MSNSADDVAYGRRLAVLTPGGIGMEAGFGRVSASWPARRSLEIFEQGLRVTAFSRRVWIPRTSITDLRRGPSYIRLSWEDGGRTNSAVFSSWAKITGVQRALDRAGYAVRW